LFSLIIIGTISTFLILWYLKAKGNYLKYSILGYTAFLLPYYLSNKLNLQNIDLHIFDFVVMITVAIFTLYSMFDYILGFIESFRKNNEK